MRLFATILSYFALTGAANAHLGHLGEAAGHGHWVALGAGIAAAALAAWIGKEKLKADGEADAAEDAGEISDEAETEPAGA